jgi:hypothetical protein
VVRVLRYKGLLITLRGSSSGPCFKVYMPVEYTER